MLQFVLKIWAALCLATLFKTPSAVTLRWGSGNVNPFAAHVLAAFVWPMLLSRRRVSSAGQGCGVTRLAAASWWRALLSVVSEQGDVAVG